MVFLYGNAWYNVGMMKGATEPRIKKGKRKMKYYYNGELVRTSKNENYKFYCPITKTCSTTKEGALKVAKDHINWAKREMNYFEKVLKKLEKGIKTRNCINDSYYTFEEIQKSIESYERCILKYSNAEVVELEARA